MRDVKWPKYKTDLSLPYSAEVKNVWTFALSTNADT
jgi:hypothetical protein